MVDGAETPFLATRRMDDGGMTPFMAAKDESIPTPIPTPLLTAPHGMSTAEATPLLMAGRETPMLSGEETPMVPYAQPATRPLAEECKSFVKGEETPLVALPRMA